MMRRFKADRFLEFVFTRLFERFAKGLLSEASVGNPVEDGVAAWPKRRRLMVNSW